MHGHDLSGNLDTPMSRRRHPDSLTHPYGQEIRNFSLFFNKRMVLTPLLSGFQYIEPEEKFPSLVNVSPSYVMTM